MNLTSFISHFAYIAVFFALGLAVGWQTQPWFSKVVKKFLKK